MSQLDQIVNIAILLQTKAIPQKSFAIPLIVGTATPLGSDLIRYYTDPDGMLSDGFTTSDAEYKHAVAAFSQALRPTQVGIGRRQTQVAQVDTITPIAVNNHHYKIKIDGVEYDYLSDGSATVNEIVTGLTTLVNADVNSPATASGSTTLILTANQAGVGFTTDIESDVDMTLVHTTANHGIVEDVVAIQNVSDLWYGIDLTSSQDFDIKDLAAWVETQTKVFIGMSNDADVRTSDTDDVMSVLKGKNYTRTGLMYTKTANNLTNGIAAAWLGGQLPQVPGSSTWKFKELVGIAADVYTPTERNILIGIPGTAGKNANIYEEVGGQDITEEGWMAGGQFIDITIGIDWFKSVAQTNIYTLLVQNPKIPYTDQGGAVIQNAITQAIKQGIGNGFIDGKSPYLVTVPPVLTIPQADRANRVLTGVTFTFRLAGAFHFIKVQGTVTV